MTVSTPWTCPNCNRSIDTAFCAACGESPVDTSGLTLKGISKKLINTFGDIDGRLVRTYRGLLQRPGMLAVAYLRGQRMPYTAPFKVFLFANMLFFAMQSLTNTSIVSETLASHLQNQDWSELAQQLVAHRIAALQTTLDLFAPVFDHAVVINAKSLIILMVLPFTLLLSVTFYGEHRPFVAHAVFALHFYAFLLLLFCVLLAVVAVDKWFGWGGMAYLDKPLFAVTLAASAIYLYFATGTTYLAKGARRVVKVLALTLIVGAMISGYRFVIFIITLYSAG